MEVSVTDFIGDKDIANERTVQLDNGNKIYMKRTDPYGYVYMNWDSGRMPEYMQGAFTDYHEARKALEKYLADINRKEVEHYTPPPVLKYKKVKAE